MKRPANEGYIKHKSVNKLAEMIAVYNTAYGTGWKQSRLANFQHIPRYEYEQRKPTKQTYAAYTSIVSAQIEPETVWMPRNKNTSRW